MADDIGTTEPTAQRVQTARRLQAMHERDGDACWWCGHRWPCTAETWAGRVLKRAATR